MDRVCCAWSLLAVLAGCANRAPIEPEPLREARSLNAAGIQRFHDGDLEEAERLFSAALAAAAAIDDQDGKAAALHNLASVHRDTGRLREALEESALAADALARAGSLDGAARARALRGQVLLALGDVGAAAAEIRDALGSPSSDSSRAGLHAVLAQILVEMGETAEAARSAEEGLALDPEDPIRSDLLFQLARARLLEKDTEAAGELLEEVLEIDRALGRRRAVADTLALLGRAACTGGDVERALFYLERAAEVYESLGLTAQADAARDECETRA
jgi:tetratricopeptide (TPR) repeat protein